MTMKKHRSWCRLTCWTITATALLLLLVVGATAGILYLVFRPKLPNYSVDSLQISDLRLLNFGTTLVAKFDVKMTATNPNHNIGIFYYKRGSSVRVWYSKTNTLLCQGSLPDLYQGHRNTTRFHVPLSGQTQYASALMSALRDQQQTGKVPLLLKVLVPIRLKLGSLKLIKVKVSGTCLLVVDSLSPNTFISIKADACKFSPHL